MKSFTDLEAWKCGMLLLKNVYKLTLRFPESEKFGLIPQLRRASCSILANLAEGFSRISPADKAHKYIICRGECSEMQALLFISKELGYVPDSDITITIELAERTGKLLTGLIHSHKK